MKQTLICKWFDRALELKEGERLYIPCLNKSDQASKRVLIYKQRVAYSSIDPDIELRIGILKEKIDEKLYVVLEKRNLLNEGFVIEVNGSRKNVILNTLQSENSLLRKVLLMYMDKIELTEIIETLTDYTPAEIK
ncbi:MAG: hypothetical protein COZ07_09775, partial [Candidatus Infernicultor aquiphilus]